jgi:hypothetical protein
MMVNLEDLEPGNPLRNVTMNTIGTEIRTKGARDWVNLAAFSIGGLTYNELGPVWTDLHEFQARFIEKPLDAWGRPA